MKLDPSESFRNSGKLRVEVLHGSSLPIGDRTGFSDPYCKFKLNDKRGALVDLGRHLKLFTDKVEHSGKVDVTVDFLDGILNEEPDPEGKG